ncbi:uncharacterized protein METZ01_LOCUS501087, partial [marine metagenome]
GKSGACHVFWNGGRNHAVGQAGSPLLFRL